MRFFPDFDREGPDGDLPRKTGLPRFWEVLSRDFGDIFRAGLLALLGGVPFLVGLAFSLTSHVLLFAPVCGFVGGAVAGPQLCGLADTILPFKNLWVPMFPALFLIYPGINENFRIEEQLRGK